MGKFLLFLGLFSFSHFYVFSADYPKYKKKANDLFEIKGSLSDYSTEDKVRIRTEFLKKIYNGNKMILLGGQIKIRNGSSLKYRKKIQKFFTELAELQNLKDNKGSKREKEKKEGELLELIYDGKKPKVFSGRENIIEDFLAAMETLTLFRVNSDPLFTNREGLKIFEYTLTLLSSIEMRDNGKGSNENFKLFIKALHSELQKRDPRNELKFPDKTNLDNFKFEFEFEF